jgi:hypothetical protein
VDGDGQRPPDDVGGAGEVARPRKALRTRPSPISAAMMDRVVPFTGTASRIAR